MYSVNEKQILLKPSGVHKRFFKEIDVISIAYSLIYNFYSSSTNK